MTDATMLCLIPGAFALGIVLAMMATQVRALSDKVAVLETVLSELTNKEAKK